MDETESAAPDRDRSHPGFGLPRLTPLRALALLAGAVVVQMLPGLPPDWVSLTLAGLALPLLFVRATSRAPVWFALGFACTLASAASALDARLPMELHGRDFDVVGTLSGLPVVGKDSTRFDFDIEWASVDGAALTLHGPARLNWYRNAPELAPCSRWKLKLRLRPPRGTVNPGGHDGERGAAQRGIVASGYVRDANDNRELESTSILCIDGWRQSIARSINTQRGTTSASSLLRALAVGDQQAISDADWQVLRATGIGHLISISGLHVGLFAAFGMLLARGFWKCWPPVTLRLPGPLIEAPVAMLCALGYGLLAGMGVPTQRTLLMIAITLLARYSRRGSSVAQALGLASTAIVLWDPLAVLAAGFWLSFAGVAILVFISQPRGGQRAGWRDLPRMQILLSLAMLPMTVWFFGQGSLIGPLANLVAVPWVSLLIVPLTVAGSLLVVDLPGLGGPLLHLADILLTLLWQLMQWMASLPSAQVHFAAAPPWAFVLALIGIVWCLLPRGVPARGLGLLLLLPLLIPAQRGLADGEFEAWMLDVGQGLAVVVRTRDHSLLYDAGPRYPGGFDVGEAVVIPSLYALGINHLDRVIISHGDSDHAGGARAVHLAFPAAIIESGEPQRLDLPASACQAGASWNWNDVAFSIVLAETDPASKGNDRSCVVLVRGDHGSLLLTGDATRRIEPAIAAALGEVSHPLVMTVPHHGSRTASSAALLEAIAPDVGLVSAGYRNRFGHPHADVLSRFEARSIALLNTAESGYLHVRFPPVPGMPLAGLPEQGRLLRPAWWRTH